MIRNTLFFFLFFLLACQEEFNYDQVGFQSGVIVVEGMFTNEERIVSINLFKAQALSGDSSYTKEPLRNARALIRSATGEVIFLKEVQSGKYSSQNECRGEIGKQYKLEVTLTDGSSFETDYAEMYKPCIIDTLFGSLGGKTTLVKNKSDEWIVDSLKVLNLNLTFEPVYGKDYNYYIEPFIIEQTFHWYYPFGRGPGAHGIEVFCRREKIASDKLVVKSASQTSSFNKINVESGYIKEFIPNVGNDTDDPSVSFGYICNIRVYSINQKVYELFENINKQVNPDNSIFDPIPTQIGTNLHFTSNKKQKVVGYFAVAGVRKYVMFFHWPHILSDVKFRKLQEYTNDYELNCFQVNKPPYWIEYR